MRVLLTGHLGYIGSVMTPMLQQAGHEAAGVRRNGLHREGGADAPFAPHGDTVEGAQHDQDGEARREARRKFDDGIEQNRSGLLAEMMAVVGKYT